MHSEEVCILPIVRQAQERQKSGFIISNQQLVNLTAMRGVALRGKIELDGTYEQPVFGSDHEDTLTLGDAVPDPTPVAFRSLPFERVDMAHQRPVRDRLDQEIGQSLEMLPHLALIHNCDLHLAIPRASA